MACAFQLTGMANGQCAPVIDGTDPHDTCLQTPQRFCGTTGDCKGGQCVNWPMGTPCDRCDGTGFMDGTCDGAMTCVELGYLPCGVSPVETCCVLASGEAMCSQIVMPGCSSI